MLLSREQLQERLLALHRASLELVQDVTLEHLLRRIAELACEQAEAQYAAVGVFGNDGKLETFISVGILPENIGRIPHHPVGKGLLGELRDACPGNSGTSKIYRISRWSSEYGFFFGSAHSGW